MTRPITRIIALTTCLLMGIFAAQAFGNNYNHINSLARKIHNKSKVLLKETKHYRSTPNYVRMVRDVAELDQLACHLRDIAKNEGDLDHLAYDIAKIDAKFHHIEYLFDTTELCASTYGRGFIKGHTAHVKRLLDSIEDAICHIGDDIEHLRAATRVFNYGTRPVVTRVETFRVPKHIAPNYGAPNGKAYRAPYGGSKLYRGHHGHRDHYARGNYGHDRGQESGFSIGGGSSRITFRF